MREAISNDINCSVDLRSTTAVGDRRYNEMRKITAGKEIPA